MRYTLQGVSKTCSGEDLFMRRYSKDQHSQMEGDMGIPFFTSFLYALLTVLLLLLTQLRGGGLYSWRGLYSEQRHNYVSLNKSKRNSECPYFRMRRKFNLINIRASSSCLLCHGVA